MTLAPVAQVLGTLVPASDCSFNDTSHRGSSPSDTSLRDFGPGDSPYLGHSLDASGPLCADGEAVGGVLDVAPDDGLATGRQLKRIRSFNS